ncbi:MAG: sigma-70 family RNA polymerase sigma factor [Ignavibacteriales bacterium]|nr:sigma-70 family RNA polymerase sigma factor [Ignavibacteriales bacterium]
MLSDVFVIIWRKSNLFDFDNGNVYSWIINLTRNKALDFLSRQKDSTSLPEYDDSFEDENIIPHSILKSELPEIKLALDRKEIIDKAFKKLTDAQQYVINLAYYEGLTSDEIAARLHIPPQTVKAKIKVAVNILRDNLSKGEAV